jgi:hypothetical protein
MERKTNPIIPAIAGKAFGPSLDRLFAPARFFERPRDVLADGSLDVQEKRAILSSWASDACAVESMPALRHPPGVQRAVSFDEIMDALMSLDGPKGPVCSGEGGNQDSPHQLDS